MNETNTAERKAIRRLMRERRRSLGAAEQRVAATSLAANLFSLQNIRHARNIAAYLAVQGEIPLEPVIETAWSLEIPVYLPRLRDERMEFHRYTSASTLIPNRFGIPEPQDDPATRLDARFLDVVLAPLVAFDLRGGRLGTGGGYYDRTFAFLREREHRRSPAFIGVAHEFQQVSSVPVAEWDVPLQAVVTDASTHLFRHEQEEE